MQRTKRLAEAGSFAIAKVAHAEAVAAHGAGTGNGDTALRHIGVKSRDTRLCLLKLGAALLVIEHIGHGETAILATKGIAKTTARFTGAKEATKTTARCAANEAAKQSANPREDATKDSPRTSAKSASHHAACLVAAQHRI